jgi:hypothetical protein
MLSTELGAHLLVAQKILICWGLLGLPFGRNPGAKPPML